MSRIIFSNPSYNYRELIKKKDIRSVAKEFEAILLKQVLKEAYRPLIKGKGFYQRLYYDMFLEGVSSKLAEAGGIGIAKFIVESYQRSSGDKDLRDMVGEMVQREGLPSWVALIPEVESGYNPRAVSKKGAAGLWQLMPETARSLGLRVDEHRDERFDPVKSTRVALSYIKQLYRKFRDPRLVLIAYNWGEGNLLRAGIDKVLSNPELLPQETQAYLKRFKELL